ncbi:hypothetical protein QUC_3220, partial [Clostridioides difficile P50]
TSTNISYSKTVVDQIKSDIGIDNGNSTQAKGNGEND